MSIPETIPVLDLKPLQYNPFSDGTVVYDNAGGVLVPRSAGSMVDPLGENPLTQNRPSNASTQGLIDSAQSTAKSGVKANAAALRGYQTTGGFFNTDAFERGLNHLSDSELDNFIDGLKTQGAVAAAEAAATAPRQAAQQALRRGSQFAGALGIAIDAYNVGDAILDPTNNPADEIGDVAGSMIGGALGSGLGPLGALGGSLVGGWLGRQLGNLLQGDGARARSHESSAPPFIGGQERGVTYKFRMKYRWYTFESGKGTPPVHTPWIEKISYWPHPNLAKKTFVGPATYKSIESISQSGSVEYSNSYLGISG